MASMLIAWEHLAPSSGNQNYLLKDKTGLNVEIDVFSPTWPSGDSNDATSSATHF